MMDVTTRFRASQTPFSVLLSVVWFALVIPCSTFGSMSMSDVDAAAIRSASDTTSGTSGTSPIAFRYRARVAYDGSNFQGFQIQQRKEETNWAVNADDSSSSSNADRKKRHKRKVKRTVQGVLESVLCQRLQDNGIRVLGAGRTDAGVHARGQAIHFDCCKNLTSTEASASLHDIEKSINAMLPSDVCIWSLQAAPSDMTKMIHGRCVTKKWNVMYDSTRKLYSYRLNVAPVMDPLLRQDRWHPDLVHVWLPDVKRLERVLQIYVGTHDFRAFAGGMDRKEREASDDGREGNVNTVRTVFAASLVCEDDIDNGLASLPGDSRNTGNYRIDIWISGGMYKQIRNMVGAALEVCRGKNMNEDDLRRLLCYDENKNDERQDDDDQRWSRKDLRTKPAPPHGLTLEHVYFDDDENF